MALSYTLSPPIVSVPVALSIRTLPSDAMRILSLPAVSNEIVSAAGNLIAVFVSPV